MRVANHSFEHAPILRAAMLTEQSHRPQSRTYSSHSSPCCRDCRAGAEILHAQSPQKIHCEIYHWAHPKFDVTSGGIMIFQGKAPT
ncbi:MAG TPA: hypothetical protein VJS42_11990 [Steroidobacteraceae bacterium]|nr:hypothetical protein [Steroidobacteraceae bacterium]